MAITRIGSQKASAATLTVPTHAVGDLIVFGAFRENATPPSLGAGYTNLGTQIGTTCSMRVGWKIATATNDAAGTWTNATELICVVYRPSAGKVIAAGNFSGNAGTTNTINFPALSLSDASGSSFVGGFIGHRSINENLGVNVPSGMTNVIDLTDATGELSLHDTNAGVTGWSSTNITGAGTASGWTSMMFEVVDAAPALITRDGLAANNTASGSTSFNASISTTLTDDIIVAAIQMQDVIGTSFTGVSGSTLGSFTQLDLLQGTAHDIGSGNSTQAVAIYWKKASAVLTNEVVTASFGGTFNAANMCLTAWNGCDLTSPWDGSAVKASSPAFNTASTPTVSSFSTTNATTEMIAVMGSQEGTAPTVGSGWTSDNLANNPNTFTEATFGQEHKYVTSAQSGISVAFGNTHRDWHIMVAALKAASAGGVTGTLATTEAKDTMVFNGSVLIEGTLATTEATDVTNFVGTVGVSGSLATTETQDTPAFVGFVGVSGTLATTEAQDVPAFVGSVIVSGALATTEAQDVAAFAGTVFVVITGTLVVTEATDTVAFAGQVVISAALATTEAPDIAAFAGQAIISAALATIEAPDTAAFAGKVGVSGTLATSEAQDTAAFAGQVVIAAALATTEAPDTAAFAGFVGVSGSLATTEAKDVMAFNGTVISGIVGSFATTEAPDVALFAGQVVISAALATTEAQDTPSFAGFVGVSGSLATTEAKDTMAFTGTVFTVITGTLATAEAKDTAAFNGAVLTGITGSLVTTEASDLPAFNGYVGVSAILAAIEASDIVVFNGTITLPSIGVRLETTESKDKALFFGKARFIGPPSETWVPIPNPTEPWRPITS